MGDWGDGEEVGGVEVGLDWGGRPGWSGSELVDVGADGGLGWGGRAGGRLVVLDFLEGRRGGELGLQREMTERELELGEREMVWEPTCGLVVSTAPWRTFPSLRVD